MYETPAPDALVASAVWLPGTVTVGAVWSTLNSAVAAEGGPATKPVDDDDAPVFAGVAVSVAVHVRLWSPSFSVNDPLEVEVLSSVVAPSLQRIDATPLASAALTLTEMPLVPLDAALYQPVAAFVAELEIVIVGGVTSAGVAFV